MEANGKWVKILGVATPGGDPAWRCSNCYGDEHVAGIETPYNLHHKCKECGSVNSYPWRMVNKCYEKRNTNAV